MSHARNRGTITTADANAGQVTNTATASATNPNGAPLTSDPAQTTVTVSGNFPVTGHDLSQLITIGLLTATGGLLLLLASTAVVRRRTR